MKSAPHSVARPACSGPASDAVASRVPPRAWLIIVLCGFAGAFFYMDRQTLSVLKTTLKGELGWSDTDYGWVVTTFMACYTACYLLTGRWIDRWGTRLMMPLFIGAMSVATLCSGLARNLGEMSACRALLGLAEAGVMPAIMVAVYSWVPLERRGLASSVKEPLFVAGQVLATPLAALITERWSWHFAFILPGILGLFVAFAWSMADRGQPIAPVTAVPGVATYRDILRRREIWGVLLARLISDPLWFFFIYWEPGFLQDRLGFSLGDLARIGWIPTAAGTATLLILGWFSNRLVARGGWSPARSRRTVLQWAAVLAPLVIVLQFTRQPVAAITILCLLRVMMVVWLNFSNLLMADLVPTGAIGTSVALMSACGAATGLLCNALVGPAVTTLGYGAIFGVGACLHPLAAFVLWVAYGRQKSAAHINPPETTSAF